MHKEVSLPPKYQEMIHGVNITPEQDKTLRELYERATIATMPWAHLFAGALASNMAFCVYAFSQYEQKHNKEILAWFFAAAFAQVAYLAAVGYKKHKAEKQLLNKIDEIKRQNGR